jgi:hypothetical protein
VIIYRKLDKSESSKAAKQQPIIIQITSSVVAASVPPPMVGTDLMACSNVDARHCARQVLQYVESLKDAEANQAGNRSSFTTSSIWLFC